MSHNYQNIEVNEAVLMAYINAELPADVAAEVEQWLKANPENEKVLHELKKTWEATANVEPKPVAVDTDAAWLKVKSQIDTTPVIPISTNKASYVKIALGIAASIAIVFSLFNFWNTPIQNIELMATQSKVEKTLADGSAITINKNSELTYPENFGKTERKVKLKGNAFFDIARDTSLPFTIELPQNAYVKVLGTSFTINTNDLNNTTTVFVKTGKVEFGNNANKIVLSPNEKGVFHADSKVFEKVAASQEKAETLYWIDEQLLFEGERLEDIVTVLSTVFNADITLECSDAAGYPIVSKHEKESLDTILEVISLVHGLTITKQTEKGKTKYLITCNA